jgi:hypothetical protein
MHAAPRFTLAQRNDCLSRPHPCRPERPPADRLQKSRFGLARRTCRPHLPPPHTCSAVLCTGWRSAGALHSARPSSARAHAAVFCAASRSISCSSPVPCRTMQGSPHAHRNTEGMPSPAGSPTAAPRAARSHACIATRRTCRTSTRGTSTRPRAHRHLLGNVGAAHKLAAHVQLRNGRPLAVGLDGLAQAWVVILIEHVDHLEVGLRAR